MAFYTKVEQIEVRGILLYPDEKSIQRKDETLNVSRKQQETAVVKILSDVLRKSIL